MLDIRPGQLTFTRSRLALCLILTCTFLATSCNKNVSRNKGDIGLDQDVTNTTKPQDIIFVDFQKNWKKFISSSREFTLPVIPIKQTEQEAWQPIVQQECVFSPDAGGNVPQVTITWSDPSPSLRVAEARQQATAVRFDISLHYQGFERNFYTTALSTAKLQRFNLPSNSALIANPDAVMLTGPGLFPKLIDYHTVLVKATDSDLQIPRQTLILRDLAPGLAYKLRKATLGAEQWNGDRQFTFSTPVCPKDF